MSKLWNLAIVGADGVVGQAFLEALQGGEFPLGELYCLGSGGEDDATVLFNSRNYPLLDTADFDFAQVDLAVFSDVPETEVELTVNAAKAGAMVITNQPAFAYATDIPLAVAGINDESLADAHHHNIVAVPDASAAIALKVLYQVHRQAGLAAVDLVAMEAVSESGQAGIGELAQQTAMLLNAKPIEAKIFPQQIAFNLIGLSGDVGDNGNTRRESGVCHAIQKVLGDPGLAVDTSVWWAPVFHGHSLELAFTTQQGITLEALAGLWKSQAGVNWQGTGIATAVTDAAQSNDIYVRRLRQSSGGDWRYRCAVVADNLRAGQADNMLAVAQILIRDYL